MNWICPVCNGMSALHLTCPSCNNNTVDEGKVSDYWAPYSPYREVEDLKRTDGYVDAGTHRCIHMAYCANCDCTYVSAIPEVSQTSI